MSPEQFRGYLRAAVWLQNKHLAEMLHVLTLSSTAAQSGSSELFDKIAELQENLTTAHESLS